MTRTWGRRLGGFPKRIAKRHHGARLRDDESAEDTRWYLAFAMKLLQRLWRPVRHRQNPRKPVQGEEYEIEKAEREAQKERDRYAESLLEKAGQARYPFLKDAFE